MPTRKIKVMALSVQLVYWLVVGLVSAYVLVMFLKPSYEHVGINQYERAKFMEMVNGTAYQPFVYRALLPGLVRLAAALLPESAHLWITGLVEQNTKFELLFRVFEWETQAAFEYLFAALLMWICFMGFGHFGAKLTLLTCKIQDRSGLWRLVLAMAIVLFLIPFFKYASYIYDPPQLFLFTLALYCLANNQVWAFLAAFGVCCINKETALLLIPIFALIYWRQLPWRRYFALLAGQIGAFVAIKLLITSAFQSNPGALVEFHLTDHNLPWFVEQMSFTHIIVFIILLALALYRLKEKDRFLKIAFLCTFPALFVLTLFLGYIDEWRDYYEAYPIAFAMIVDSLRQFKLQFQHRLRPPDPFS